MVQSPVQPAMSRTKLRMRSAPCGVCATSGMELDAVEPAALVGDDREGRVRETASGSEPVGQLGDPVAVAHPDRVLLAHVPDALEERAVGEDLDLGAAELRVMPALDLAAELRRHGLLAVADAEAPGCRPRTAPAARGATCRSSPIPGRPTGSPPSASSRERPASAFWNGTISRIDALLAHAPGDELGHLGAEIDDEDLVVGLGHGRELGDCGRGSNAGALERSGGFSLSSAPRRRTRRSRSAAASSAARAR